MATAATLQATPAHQQQTHHDVEHIPNQSTSYSIPRGVTESDLTFYGPPPDGAAPWNYVETPPAGSPQRNYSENLNHVQINDVRGNESAYNTDTHAFAVTSTTPSAEKDFTSDASIKENYYPEVESLLLKHLPGTPNRIFLFDHTIRRSSPGAPRAPVTRVHIDQTPKSARQRVEHHLPDEAETLLKSRVRIVNVWRPLNGPVVASPLAFAASDSVPDSCVVPVEHRYPDRTGETAGIQFSEGQKWFYWSGMGNDERIFLQCFDSEKGARVPHTAFPDPKTPANAPGRESIEVRALVFG